MKFNHGDGVKFSMTTKLDVYSLFLSFEDLSFKKTKISDDGNIGNRIQDKMVMTETHPVFQNYIHCIAVLYRLFR